MLKIIKRTSLLGNGVSRSTHLETEAEVTNNSVQTLNLPEVLPRMGQTGTFFN